MLAAVLAVFVLLGCHGGDDDAAIKSCPSAPFRPTGIETPCDFEGSCSYEAPHSLGTASEGTCAPLDCQCKMGTLKCLSSGVGCTRLPDACPLGISADDACDLSAELANGECLFGAGQAGVTATHACSCDLPGPIWRCVPL
jgi:hypothetical protein